jgi:carboxypeptidase Q
MFLPATSARAQAADPAQTYRAAANRLIDAALRDSAAYDRLAELTERFGHRFSGSESLERAISTCFSSRSSASSLLR